MSLTSFCLPRLTTGLPGAITTESALPYSYLSSYLQEASISHVIYGADATAADRHWSTRHLFQNFDTFVDAVNGKGSLYAETLEILLNFSPKMVVIAASEPLLATKNWANPFIAANFSKLLRQCGIYTVGIGHFLTLDHERFRDDFDCILGGEPSPAIVEIFRGRPVGYIPPVPIGLDVLPSLNHVFPAHLRSDYVMSSFGCRFQCAFYCIAHYALP